MGDFYQTLDELHLTRMQKLVAMRWLRPEGVGEPRHIGTFKTEDGRESAQYRVTANDGTTHNFEVWKDTSGNAQLRTFQVAENALQAEWQGPEIKLEKAIGREPELAGRLVGAE